MSFTVDLTRPLLDMQAMQLVVRAVQQQKVDVVVYVDRLDGYRISQADRRVSVCQCSMSVHSCEVGIIQKEVLLLPWQIRKITCLCRVDVSKSI